MFISNNGNFKEGIIWWDQEIDTNTDVDVFFFIHDYEGRAKYKYGFKSLEIDLTQAKEEIWGGFKSNLRNELRKAKTLDFEITHLTNPSNEEIELFVQTYNDFANFKGLQKTSFDLLKQMNDQKKLVLSFCKRNNELIVMHSHYSASHKTRLYQSCSSNNSFDGKTNALANKYLTEKDIIFFKNNNFKVYDFGGIGNVEGDNTRFEGIIKFKKQFSANEVILWKGVTPNGETGKKIYKKYWK